MDAISETLQNSRKIVIKIGSNVLATDDGKVDREAVATIVGQINDMISRGKEAIVVSSGAGAFGAGAINKLMMRKDIHNYQALCAIGQVEMMMAYKEFFAKNGTHVAQMLLTRDDFANEQRTLHIRNTLFTLIDEGIVPIINENDTVSVDEIKSIGDNDTLGALTAQLWNADCYIILSDIDGVFDKNPKEFDDAELVEEVYDIDGLLQEISISGTSQFGKGGIHTKIEAARRLGEYGIPTILLNGTEKNIITEAREGEASGTGFFFNR